MPCPKCYGTMIECDDCGDGSKGRECVVCGYCESDADEICYIDEEGEPQPHYAIDDQYGRPVCAWCEKEL